MATTTAAKKGKTHEELYQDLFDPERLVPGLRLELETLPGVLLPQLEQVRAQIPTAEAEELAAADALAQAEIRGASQAEVAKLATAYRKAKEATERAWARRRVLEAAVPAQEALVRAKWDEVTAAIQKHYALEYRKLIADAAAAARQLSELVAKEQVLRDTACRVLRKAARDAGRNPEAINTGAPAMFGVWERHVGELRHPNSNVSLWLKGAREQGYDVGDSDR